MRNPAFHILERTPNLHKKIRYVDGRNGYFETVPLEIIQEPVAELTAGGYLSLVVGVETGTIYQLDGVTTKSYWPKKTLEKPMYKDARLIVDTANLDKERGMAYDTPLTELFEEYDSKKGIWRISLPGMSNSYTRIFENLVIGLKDERLHSIYVFDV